VALGRGIVIAASGLGKSKMVAQVISIFMLILGQRFPWLRGPALFSLWVVVGLATISGVDYFRRFWREVVRSERADAAPVPEAPIDSGSRSDQPELSV